MQQALIQLLRKVRKEAGLTQVELAKRLDVLQCEISNYERGEKRLDIVELTQVIDAIGITLNEFIDRFEKATGRK